MSSLEHMLDYMVTHIVLAVEAEVVDHMELKQIACNMKEQN